MTAKRKTRLFEHGVLSRAAKHFGISYQLLKYRILKAGDTKMIDFVARENARTIKQKQLAKEKLNKAIGATNEINITDSGG